MQTAPYITNGSFSYTNLTQRTWWRIVHLYITLVFVTSTILSSQVLSSLSQSQVTTSPSSSVSTRLPDITITAGDLNISPVYPTTDTPISLDLSIKNTGVAPLEAASLTITSTLVADNSVIFTKTIPQAISGIEASGEATINIPSFNLTQAGRHLVCVQLTAATAGDMNPANNQACRAISVAGPINSPEGITVAHLNGQNQAQAPYQIFLPDVRSNESALNHQAQPILFVPNKGQLPTGTHFSAQGLGGNLYFKDDGIVFSLPVLDAISNTQITEDQAAQKTFSNVYMRLENAQLASHITGDQQQLGKFNYFLGDEQENWYTNLASYGSIIYTDIYPGIDVRYDGLDGLLKSTYTVAPGADPSQIRWWYEGATETRINAATGNLEVVLLDQQQPLIEEAPIAWQIIDNQKIDVPVVYNLDSQGRASFKLNSYNTNYPLLIDPPVLYATYMGGSQRDVVYDLTRDNDGFIYLTGFTDAPPISAAISSTIVLTPTDITSCGFSSCSLAFVAKFNPAGELLYQTYLGSYDLSQSAIASAIAIDSDKAVYITGRSRGSYPVRLNLDEYSSSGSGNAYDAFITKLSPTGDSIVYSSLFGGSREERAFDIAVDANKHAYITGYTHSDDLTTTSSAYQSSCAACNDPSYTNSDAFLAKFVYDENNDSLQLDYASYLGGDDGSSQGHGLAVPSANNVYLVGGTASTTFPTLNAYDATYNLGATDLFVARFNTAASGSSSLVYASYLGGSDDDTWYDWGNSSRTVRGSAIAVDSSGAMYVTSSTKSSDFPVTTGASRTSALGASDVIITKIAPSGTSLVYSTYAGGSGIDNSFNITLDSNNNAYIVGQTTSRSFSALNAPVNHPSTNHENYVHAFVASLDSTGSKLASMWYIGDTSISGSVSTSLDTAYGVAVGSIAQGSPEIYVGGITASSGFTTTSGAFQTSFGGATDGFWGRWVNPVITTTSTFAVTERTLTANGTDTSIITATLRDGLGLPLADRPVRLVQNGSSVSVNLGGEVLTDASGQVVFQVKSTRAGTLNLHIKDMLGSQLDRLGFVSLPVGMVTFEAGPVHPLRSLVVTSHQTARATGTDPITVTVVLRDESNNLLASQPVTMTVSGSASLSATSGTTDANGRWQTTITDTVPEQVTISAFSDGVAIAQRPQVSFIQDAPELALSVKDLVLSEQTPISGESITFTLTLRNNGPITITQSFVVITDTFQQINTPLVTYQTLSTPIVGYGKKNFSFSNRVLNGAGRHTICVQVGVLATAPSGYNEVYLDNNIICKDVSVIDHITPILPLSLRTPSFDTWKGAEASWTVQVQNTGIDPLIISTTEVLTSSWALFQPLSALPSPIIQPGDSLQLSYAVSVTDTIPEGVLPLTETLRFVATTGTGLRATEQFDLSIVSAPPTTLTVQVVDIETTESGVTVIPNTLIMIDGDERVYVTDGAGRVTIPARPGRWGIYAYHSDYIARSERVLIEESQANSHYLMLTKGQTVEVTGVEARPLTPEEAAERGVELSDPANMQVLDFIINLKFEQEIYVPNFVSGPAGGYGRYAEDGPTGGYYVSGGVFMLPGVDHRVETWIIIPGRFRFLKQFWEATIYINNAAQTVEPDDIELRSLNVGLDIPEGLGLPDLNGQPQVITQTVASLLAGQGHQFEWVLRGDAAGTYQVGANVEVDLYMNGQLGPAIEIGAEPAEVKIYAPLLDVIYTVPSVVVTGEQFTVIMDIVNMTEIPMYDLYAEIKKDEVINAHLDEPEWSKYLGDLAPGQHAVVSFVFVSHLTGCVSMRRSYVETFGGINSHLNFQPSGCGGMLGYTTCTVGIYNFSVSGNYPITEIDLNKHALAQNDLFQIVRTYNSSAKTGGVFGAAWHSNLDMKIAETDHGGLLVTQADGNREVYNPIDESANTTYLPAIGTSGSVVKSSIGYTLTTTDQKDYGFDLAGKLVRIVEDPSRSLELNYTAGRVSSLSDSLGRTLTITMTANRISQISDGTSTTHYGYHPRTARLTSVTDGRGYSRGYGYNKLGLLTEQYDEFGNLVVKNEYDGNNRLSSQTRFSGPLSTQRETVSYDYDSLPNAVILTDARGYKTTVYLDEFTKTPIGTVDSLGTTRQYELDNKLNPVKVTMPNGTELHSAYNSWGMPTVMTSTVTVDGSTQVLTSTVSYDAKNNPLQVADPQGNTTSYEYTDLGKPSRVLDPLNNETLYSYDTKGRLTQATFEDGLVADYSYNTTGLLSSVTYTYDTLITSTTTLQERQERIDFSYTPQGWIRSQSDPYELQDGPGAGISFGYDAIGNIITTTNQLNQTSFYSYNATGKVISSTNELNQTKLYGYDWQGRLTSTTDVTSQGNLVTSYVYDGNGNLVSRTDPRGVTITYTYDAANRLKTTTVPLNAGGVDKLENFYDIAGNLIEVVRYNPKGSSDHVTQYSYDELGRVVEQTDAAGSYAYKTRYTYDKNSNIIRVKKSKVANAALTNWNDPSQVVTTQISYDALDRPLSVRQDAWDPISNTNKDLTTTYIYSDSLNLTSVIDPSGVIATVERDGKGQSIIQRVTPSNQTGLEPGAAEQTSYVFYDLRGLPIRTIDPLNYWNEASYDLLGRIVSATAYTEANGGGTALTQQNYYIDQQHPKLISIGAAPDYARVDQTFDEFGQITQSTIYTGGPVSYPQVPTGAISTNYSYDTQGNLVAVTDALGQTSNYSYETTGWLLEQETDVTLADSGLQTVTVSYEYDNIGNLIAVTDADNHRSTMTYDALNRMLSATDVLSNTLARSYDGLGRLVSNTDPLGQQTQFVYDNASRLRNVANIGINTEFSYGNTGQLESMIDTVGSNPASTTFYRYDGLQRLAEIENPQGLVQYGYDLGSRLTDMRFGQNESTLKQVSYSYDGLDRLQSVTNWLSDSLTYSYRGERLSKLTYPTGVTTKFGYDGAGQLTGLTHAADGRSLFGAEYEYDRLGRVTTAFEKQDSVRRIIDYSYDELSRVRSEVETLRDGHTLTTTYDYDIAGDRVFQQAELSHPLLSTDLISTTSFTYDPAHRMVSREVDQAVGGQIQVTSTYDANSNLTGEVLQTLMLSDTTVYTYTYDARDRLIGWQKQLGPTGPPAIASFSYDGHNQRTRLSFAGQNIDYLAVGGLTLQERTSGEIPLNYLYTPNSGTPLFRASSAPGEWFHHDPNGSVRAVSNSTRTSLVNYAFDSFGVTTGTQGSSDNTRQFAGMQLDPTELYYAGCSYYDPVVARTIGGCDNGASPSDAASGGYAGNGSSSSPNGPLSPTSGALDAGQADQLGKLLFGGGPWSASGQACSVFCNYQVSMVQGRDPNFTFNKPIAPGDDGVSLADEMVYAGLGFLPGIGNAIGVYEFFSGYDLFGRKLSTFDRFISGISAFIPMIGGLHDGLVAARAALRVEGGLARSVGLFGRELRASERAAAAMLRADPRMAAQAARAADDIGDAARAGRAARAGASLADDAHTARALSREADAASLIGGRCNSFSADTTVATPEGDIPIAEIEIGDLVYAWDELSDTISVYTVSDTISHIDPVIVLLTIGDETIETTPEHPFYTLERGWVNAEDLRFGERVPQRDGEIAAVLSIELVQRTQRMYNLTVEVAHTFFVGDQQWLVHNAKRKCPSAGTLPKQRPIPEMPEDMPQDLKDAVVQYTHDLSTRPWGGGLPKLTKHRVASVAIVRYSDGSTRVLRGFSGMGSSLYPRKERRIVRILEQESSYSDRGYLDCAEPKCLILGRQVNQPWNEGLGGRTGGIVQIDMFNWWFEKGAPAIRCDNCQRSITPEFFPGLVVWSEYPR